MLIGIVRSTMATPAGECARAVDPGEVIEVDQEQGLHLIHLGKAMPVEAGALAASFVETPEDALPEYEIRPEPRKKRRT